MASIYLSYTVSQAQLTYDDILALGGFDAIRETMSFGGETVATRTVHTTYQGYAISELSGMSYDPPPSGETIGSPSFNTHDVGTEWWPSQPIQVADDTVIPLEYQIDSGFKPFELFSEDGSLSFEWSHFHLNLNTNIGFSPTEAMKGAISGALNKGAVSLLGSGIVNAFEQAGTVQTALDTIAQDALDLIAAGTSDLQNLTPSEFGGLIDDYFAGLQGPLRDALADTLRSALPSAPPLTLLDLPGMSLEADFDWQGFLAEYLVERIAMSATDVREELFTIGTQEPVTIENTVAKIQLDFDVFRRTDYDDLIIGVGNTTLIGGGGDDVLVAGGGGNTLIGGTGDDTLFGGSGNDHAILGEGGGDDIFYGGGGVNTISYPSVSTGVIVNLSTGIATGPEIDTDTLVNVHNVIGSLGDDHITGDAGHNRLVGDFGDDLLIGSAGVDTLFGGPGADVLKGGGGDDVLRGGGGNDKMIGGPGHDKLFGGPGADVLKGGGGNDAIRGGGGNDKLLGGPGADKLFGGGDNDRLMGGGGNDVLRGGGGNDVLRGGPGNDRLIGGPGDDRLFGGPGKEVLIGGLGADKFVYKKTAHIGNGFDSDIIRDFTPGQDVLNLSSVDANTLVGGNQGFTFIGGANFSAAGQLRYDSGVLSGDVNGDGNADFAIRFANSAAVSSDDIIL